MKTNTLEILGDIDFLGRSNSVILIESDKPPLYKFLSGENNIIFTQEELEIPESFNAKYTILMLIDSIYKVNNIIKSLPEETELDFIIIHRIDMMDIHLDRRKRGALMKGILSMMCSKQFLRGANLVITSEKTEYSIREIADKHYTI